MPPALLKRHQVQCLGSVGPPGCGLLVAHTPRWISRLRTFVLMTAGTPTSEEGPQWGTVSQEGTRRWQGIQRGQEEAKLLLATLCLWPGQRTKPTVPALRQQSFPRDRAQAHAKGRCSAQCLARVMPTALRDWPGALPLGRQVSKGTEQHRNLDHFTEDRGGHGSALSPALALPSGRDARHCHTQDWARARRGGEAGASTVLPGHRHQSHLRQQSQPGQECEDCSQPSSSQPSTNCLTTE